MNDETYKRIMNEYIKDAFCCYNQNDSEDVNFIVEELSNQGIITFIDNNIEPGQNWIEQIQKMIVSSETFLFFVRTAPTTWQMQELSIAINLQTAEGKPHIIPVLLPNLQDNAFFDNPNVAILRNHQAAQFSQSVKELDVISGLARSIIGNSRVYISSRAMPRPDKLPSGFQADLGRLTELLIGESVYKSQDISVRELIQNARDACSLLVAQHDLGLRNPEVIVRVDEHNRYFDVIDYGDGMSRDVLANSFSVLGKGLNDSFHVETQDLSIPVTGKFGIGFVSTFMIAERVVVSTRAPNDQSYHFKIFNPKNPFQYLERSTCDRNGNDTGTTIRVYLKQDYAIGASRLNIPELTKKFCRHVPDLYLVDSQEKYRIESDWNHGKDDLVISRIASSNYEIHIGWSTRQYDSIILSNGGNLKRCQESLQYGGVWMLDARQRW